ncbi:SIR2 family protein [Microbacterium sp. Sa4CUA7]|uniref:SIR2 family protein n=1 Tax=Microbacterium pullorum TaxID=2762236 RepID=A0ABR8RYS9_9MICO|nr:SIR2 family protein [Microbacterium pullorum]MBD7956394.1 SIR2 family protein [Microbacterium pullorum]
MSLNAFARAVSSSGVVFVVGTGASAALSGKAPTATWLGLLESGRARAEQTTTQASGWSALVDMQISFARETGSSEAVIGAAGMITSALGGKDSQNFADWLRAEVGQLPLQDDRLAKALCAYPFPILTTNYDDLIERASGRPSATWTDAAHLQRLLAGESEAIGHLHGTWDQPGSLVLTESDYAAVVADAATQALQKAISSVKTLVYVGFGAGMADPNLGELLKWHRQTFQNSGVHHVRLCRAREVDDLRREHANDAIEPVAYGDNYEDLAPFLEAHLQPTTALSLTPAGMARDAFAEAREELALNMRSESVLEELLDVAHSGEAGVILPPILSSVPHSVLTRRRRGSGAQRLPRLHAADIARSDDFVVVVGDEGAGVTTALKWLANEASRELGAAAPIYVPFHECRATRVPLGAAIEDRARQLGLIARRGDAVPDIVLALDDFDPEKPRVSTQVMGELAQGVAVATYVGCRSGREEEIVGQLRSRGVIPRTVYVGRLRKSDVEILARCVAPSEGERIAAELIEFLDNEGLQRTPFNVTLLLYLLVSGKAPEVSSSISLLDSYVELLLMHGDPHHAISGPLTGRDVEAILTILAQRMVEAKVDRFDEVRTLEVVQSAIDSFSWPASASEVVAFLLGRRVLRRDGTEVHFSRSAVFLLYAAKRASADPDFRSLITSDVFWYAPLVTRYAALVRHDRELLARSREAVLSVLDQPLELGSPYDVMAPIEVIGPESHKELAVTQAPRLDIEDYDVPEGGDRIKYNLVLEKMRPPAVTRRIVEFSSAVLRDSDQVADLDLKRDMLEKVLETWGRVIAMHSFDARQADFQAYLTRMVELSSDDTDWKSDEDKADFIESLSKSIPVATAVGGMTTKLVTPKLEPVFSAAITNGGFQSGAERITAGMLFAVILGAPSWPQQVMTLLNTAENTWITSSYLRWMCEDRYVSGPPSDNLDDVLKLCVLLRDRAYKYGSASDRASALDGYRQGLRSARLADRATPADKEDTVA